MSRDEDDDDPHLPDIRSPEHRHALHERGAPHGNHIREHDDEGPPRVSDYLKDGEAGDLRRMLERMRLGETPPPKPVKPTLDLTLNIPTIVMLAGMLVGGIKGWDALSDRVAGTERGIQDGRDRAQKYVPVIEALSVASQGQSNENKMQNDRIQSVAAALADERKSRQDDAAEARSAQTAIMALIAKYADKLADIDKSVAVMQGPGRRSDAAPPEHDAYLPPSSHPR